MSQKERDINIITLGQTGVGKTSILNRLKNDIFMIMNYQHLLLIFLFSKKNMKKES